MTPASLTLAAIFAMVACLITAHFNGQARDLERASLIENAKDRAFRARRAGQCDVLCNGNSFTVVDGDGKGILGSGVFRCLCSDNTVIERSDK